MSSERECPVAGCATTHDRSLLMCRHHWYRVPKRLRDALWRAYRSEESILGDAYQQARAACIAAAEAG